MKVRYLVFGFVCFLGGMTAGFIYKTVNKIATPAVAKEAPKPAANGISMLAARGNPGSYRLGFIAESGGGRRETTRG